MKFKIGDVVQLNGAVGPKMVIESIHMESRIHPPILKCINLKYWDPFLAEWKSVQLNSAEMIEIATE